MSSLRAVLTDRTPPVVCTTTPQNLLRRGAMVHMGKTMYENMAFGDVTTAKSVRKSTDDIKTFDDASVEHDERLGRLNISGINESPKMDVFVALTDGEVKSSHGRVGHHQFAVESEVDVTDDEMTITIEREAEVITLSVECEGEVTDDSGPDLERFGVDI